MLRAKRLVIDTLKNDATIQGYVVDRVYAAGIDIIPEILPAITVQDVSESIRTVPLGKKDIIIQVDIWSITNQLEVDNIYERIQTLINFRQLADDGTNQVYWMREDSMVDLPESERRIWHKAIRYRTWAK